MALTSDEKAQLQIFSGIGLSKTQVETILRRSLTDREWRAYNCDYKVTYFTYLINKILYLKKHSLSTQ